MAAPRHASIERLLHRICMDYFGAATPLGPLRWQIEIAEEAEAEPLRFTQTVSTDGLVLHNDAEVLTVAQGTLIGRFQTDFATALRNERIVFDSFAQLAAYLEGQYAIASHLDDGYIVFNPETEHPIAITAPTVAREPWIELSVDFPGDANPAWLLEQNGHATCVRFEITGDDHEIVKLVSSLPLLALTGQRIIDIIGDLITYHGNYLRDFEAGDEAEDDDGDEATVWDEQTAIIGPWADKAACMQALEQVLRDIGATKLAAQVQGCSIARVYRIGATMWVSAGSRVVAALVDRLDEARIYGVETVYGESGDRAVSVVLWELELDDDGDLIRGDELGEEPEERDAQGASLDWETRLAARSINAPEGEHPSRLVYFQDRVVE
jgi:hypothetical protein